MKAEGLDINDLRACHVCKSPVAGNTRAGKTIDFHVVSVERHLLRPRALQQHIGLSMFFGGNEQLAHVMGADTQATELFTVRRVFVCNPCWMEKFEVLSLRDEPLGDDVSPKREVEA